jgi:hypothetical protein
LNQQEEKYQLLVALVQEAATAHARLETYRFVPSHTPKDMMLGGKLKHQSAACTM